MNEGAVKIDGYDVRDVTLRSLRKTNGGNASRYVYFFQERLLKTFGTEI